MDGIGQLTINDFSKSRNDKFYSSYVSNGSGWAEIQSVLNGNIGQNFDFNTFGKSINVFSNSFEPRRQY
uniref:Uncharacterized protein n=1 Tax=Panagrolaimus davidi TaxID=227884 RepID=A0A914NX94_9BILA